MVKLNKIYTRTGDGGETDLADGSRIAKEHPLAQAIGDVEQGDSDRAVGFIDVADGLRERMFLGDARTVGEAGLAAVARPGINLVELDQAATDY